MQTLAQPQSFLALIEPLPQLPRNITVTVFEVQITSGCPHKTIDSAGYGEVPEGLRSSSLINYPGKRLMGIMTVVASVEPELAAVIASRMVIIAGEKKLAGRLVYVQECAAYEPFFGDEIGDACAAGEKIHWKGENWHMCRSMTPESGLKCVLRPWGTKESNYLVAFEEVK